MPPSRPWGKTLCAAPSCSLQTSWTRPKASSWGRVSREVPIEVLGFVVPLAALENEEDTAQALRLRELGLWGWLFILDSSQCSDCTQKLCRKEYCTVVCALKQKYSFLRHLWGLEEPFHSGTEWDLQQNLPGEDEGFGRGLSLGQRPGSRFNWDHLSNEYLPSIGNRGNGLLLDTGSWIQEYKWLQHVGVQFAAKPTVCFMMGI